MALRSVHRELDMVGHRLNKQYCFSSLNESIWPGNNFRGEDEEILSLYEHYRWYYHMKIGIIAQCLYCWLNKPTVGIRLRCPPSCITDLLDAVLTDIGDCINVS